MIHFPLHAWSHGYFFDTPSPQTNDTLRRCWGYWTYVLLMQDCFPFAFHDFRGNRCMWPLFRSPVPMQFHARFLHIPSRILMWILSMHPVCCGTKCTFFPAAASLQRCPFLLRLSASIRNGTADNSAHSDRLPPATSHVRISRTLFLFRNDTFRMSLQHCFCEI